MSKCATVFATVVLTLSTIALAGWLFLRFSAGGFSARSQPTKLEAAVANYARTAAMPRRELHRINPVAPTPEAMREGMAHFADHCAVCHANDGSGDIMIGKGMYPQPPDMRLAATQQRTDGELFSVITNGVRMSGMPAFGTADPKDDGDTWKLVIFLRHLPRLTEAEQQEMRRLNPKGPDEIEEERQEEEFLAGDKTENPISKKNRRNR
jgi:mono/diheme cytochrome c family protein